jgi:hypothetical protein
MAGPQALKRKRGVQVCLQGQTWYVASQVSRQLEATSWEAEAC